MEFVDLKYQYLLYREEIQREMESVMESASFIKGPALKRFEEELEEYLDGQVHAIGCASGTDALLIGLMALGVGPGDEVIIPDFTFIATGEVVSLLGAVPVFCDVDSVSYNIDPSQISRHIGERTVGIVPVGLFGQPAEIDEINEIAESRGIWVMEDAAQCFGALHRGSKSSCLTSIATTSFFPAKPLGCYGDGGAVFSKDEKLAEKVRVILNHGQVQRYRHAEIGINGRMDSIQAAVLSVKLRHFDEELRARQRVAETYTRLLAELPGDKIVAPTVKGHNTSTWAQYSILHEDRDGLRESLKEKGIPTAVHYPIPLHMQEAFSYLDTAEDVNPVTNRVSEQIISLPMHPFLKDEEIERVVEAIGSYK